MLKESTWKGTWGRVKRGSAVFFEAENVDSLRQLDSNVCTLQCIMDTGGYRIPTALAVYFTFLSLTIDDGDHISSIKVDSYCIQL
jgi:hypothetical protein